MININSHIIDTLTLAKAQIDHLNECLKISGPELHSASSQMVKMCIESTIEIIKLSEKQSVNAVKNN